MYSHGGLEMNNGLFRLNHPALGGNAVEEDSKTSFENETESLYLTQLDSLQNGFDAAVAPAMSSAWNSDLYGSLSAAQQPRAMMMVRPEDVTGQKPVPKAEPMDHDEDDDANVMAMIEANFDLSTLMDNTSPMANSTMVGGDETQEAIDDMAQFLQTYEPTNIKQELGEEPAGAEETTQPAQAAPSCLADELLSLEQRQTLDQMEKPSQLSEEDLRDAEMLLDTLLGNKSYPEEEEATDSRQQPVSDILKTAVDSEGLADSAYQTLLEESQVSSSSRYSVANVSHCVTPDGKQVIIVVQRPTEQPQQPRRLLMPRPSTDEDEDDPAWQPQKQPQKRRPGRKREERVSLAVPSPQGVSKRSYKNIKDRKERKKIQNVEAARRYRDKKKAEQVEMEAEEAVQKAKNMRLRGQLKDIQSEVSTMKKLMRELGMLKSK